MEMLTFILRPGHILQEVEGARYPEEGQVEGTRGSGSVQDGCPDRVCAQEGLRDHIIRG